MILFMIFFPITFLGSHVTSHEGMYILQWKYYDKLAHTHLSPLDSLTAAATTHVHKSKVNFKFSSWLNVLNSSLNTNSLHEMCQFYYFFPYHVQFKCEKMLKINEKLSNDSVRILLVFSI